MKLEIKPYYDPKASADSGERYWGIWVEAVSRDGSKLVWKLVSIHARYPADLLAELGVISKRQVMRLIPREVLFPNEKPVTEGHTGFGLL